MTMTVSVSAADVAVGALWSVSVLVRDADCVLEDDEPSITVTLPDTSTAAVTVETITAGAYRAMYVPAVAGRFLVTVATTTAGSETFAFVATAVTASADMPVLADLRSSDPAVPGYLEDSSATDAELTSALEVEAAAQRRVCDIPAAYPPDLREALFRRVARNLAMRAEPRVSLPGDIPVITPSRDPEVRRLEGPFRKLVMG